MAIKFVCPHCGKRFTTKEDNAGKRAKCSACGEVTRIPSQPTWEVDDSPTPPPVPPAAPPADGEKRRPLWKDPVVVIGTAVPTLILAVFITSLAWQHFRASRSGSGAQNLAGHRATADVSRKSKFQPGDDVELVGPKDGMIFLCADEEIFMEHKSRSRRFVPGKEIFTVAVSERAIVLEDKGDRLQVKILDGHLKDQSGWISSDEVRLRPTPEEASKDVVEGLALDKRREIYAKLFRIGLLAEDEGFHQIPIIPTEDDLLTGPERNAKRNAIISGVEKKGRASLIVKYRNYNLDEAHLDRIEKEGDEKRWPLPHVADPYKR